ncbi:hypothetical protein AYW79_05730 [Ferroacidibacillus organovorans]|uniref:DUF2892 domain-containing protein n=1 Tax=Ferroacidibacillus organovorans TaxID=1765683 RepID=A0A853KBB4_9BACL|nr:hypothetical protein AYJ22_04910 [Ferroacidibacillus organovorans]OAG94365.1 hypothetical protein AYW79_05730 [Ferroacidibacillus organovorans]
MFVCSGKGSTIRLLAGIFFWVSILLGLFVNKYLMIIGGLPATMLIVSYLTGWCPTEMLLKLFGAKEQKRILK